MAQRPLPFCVPILPRPPAPRPTLTTTASGSSQASVNPPPAQRPTGNPPVSATTSKTEFTSSPYTSKTNNPSEKIVESVPGFSIPLQPVARLRNPPGRPRGSRTVKEAVSIPTEDTMLVRRAAANSARSALKKAAMEDSDDNSDMDISEDEHVHDEDEDDLTPFTTSRESTADLRTSQSTSTRASSTTTAPSSSAKQHILNAAPLDLNSVRTSAPAVMAPRKTERLFGLEHCPIYYPSKSEFTEPLEYIERIAQQTRSHGYGICKVVPPEGWQPPFSLDTETFRFSTRVQELNSMEATARANLNFMEQLAIFHRQQKHSSFTVPVSMKKPLDLWQLRKQVNAQGGYGAVCANKKWSQVGRDMGLDPNKDHHLTVTLRTAYQKIIQPFEEYRQRIKITMSPNGASQASSSSSGPGMRTIVAAGNQNASTATAIGKVSLAAKPVTLNQVQAASDKLNEALNASPSSSNKAGPSKPVTTSARSSTATPDEELPPGEVCEVCKSDEDEANILLCDDCDKGYHLSCLSPPLKKVPEDDWICDACLVGHGDDYGFEEGDEHTLASFHQRATNFRKKWLAKHPVPAPTHAGGLDNDDDEVGNYGVKQEGEWEKEAIVEDHVEREFWRLVESPTEAVEVEYGADIHTTKWGSAVPTLDKDPQHPYAKDGWNLTNLPILPGSVLRYVKSDICGMTVPWAYVGMMFSTFAWHKEDHNTYSVNYHHIGGTKTWYGVPGEDDEKLEAAVKAAAPELFEAQPDLMYQLVTLMSPGRLKEAGVRVSACDQRPNEFVITFPKAYHAGFNHDFNYNEAVNFCLPDWLEYDLEGVRKYKTISKAPVFSHDELLMTIYSYEESPKSCKWLLPLFEEMVTRELAERAKARAEIPNLAEVVEDEEQDDDQYQCMTDKSFCYLSQIVTKDRLNVACADHWRSLPEGDKVMKIRFKDEDLRAMLEQVRKRAELSIIAPVPVALAEKRKAIIDNEENDESMQAIKRARIALSGHLSKLLLAAEQSNRPSNVTPGLRAM